VTGKGPIANLAAHLSDPWNTSIMAKAVVLPGGNKIAPACAIPATATFQGIEIPTPCFLEGLWHVPHPCCGPSALSALCCLCCASAL